MRTYGDRSSEFIQHGAPVRVVVATSISVSKNMDTPVPVFPARVLAAAVLSLYKYRCVFVCVYQLVRCTTNNSCLGSHKCTCAFERTCRYSG